MKSALFALTIFSLTTSYLLFAANSVIAQSPSPDAEEKEEPVDPDVVEDNIKQRIKQAVSTNSPEPISTSDSPLGWVGLIEAISNQTITLTYNSTVRQTIYNNNTTVVDDGDEINPEDLEIGTAVISMGPINSDSIMTAKRIVTIQSLPTQPTKQTTIGTIDRLDLKEDTVTILPPNQAEPLVLNITDDSIFQQLGKDEAELDADEFNPGDQVLLIYLSSGDSNPDLEVTALYLTKPAPQPTEEQ